VLNYASRYEGVGETEVQLCGFLISALDEVNLQLHGLAGLLSINENPVTLGTDNRLVGFRRTD
jgi:hypothetical protein